MRKTLLTLCTFVACMATAWAEDVVFDFSDPSSLNPSIERFEPTEDKTSGGVDLDDKTTFTNGSVSMAIDKGTATTAIRLWTTTKNATELRTYKGSSITISASEAITGITFVGAKVTTFTPNSGTLTKGVWTGNANSVTFDVTGTLGITSVTVSFGEEPTPPTLKEVSGLAEAKTVATGKDYIINLSNAVVTYVNGANAYIEDGNAGMLVYKSNHGLVAGQSISGKVTANLALYNNLYELTTFDTSNATITDGVEIPETTVTLAELQANFAKYESMRVKVEGATATSAFESRYAYIKQDGTEMTLYQRDANAEFTFAADNRVDVVGYPGLFKDAKQLNVWEVSDVTVLGEEPPTPPVVELEELENLAEAKYREDGEYIINLENAIVTYVNGKNAYIEDGETGILIFLEEGHTLEAGQCISGKVVAKVTDYYGLCELESFDTTDAVITDGAEIPETTVTVEELLANPKKYESRRVKVVEAVAESAFTNRNANVKQDGHTLSLYQKDANAKFTFAEGDKMDVVGYLGAFREEIQLNVWEESDVTIYAVDGIGQITNGQNDVQVYTLDGRRVQKATKGIYIVNGKKMVVK